MSAEQITYNEARKLMKPGDVIDFGGKGLLLRISDLLTTPSLSKKIALFS